MTTWKGQLNQVQPYRTQERIDEFALLIGEYFTSNNKNHHSKLTLWVPMPSQVKDVPAIFLSISNPSGRTFVRLASGDFDLIRDLFISSGPALHDALGKARARSYRLQSVAAAIQAMDTTGEMVSLSEAEYEVLSHDQIDTHLDE